MQMGPIDARRLHPGTKARPGARAGQGAAAFAGLLPPEEDAQAPACAGAQEAAPLTALTSLPVFLEPDDEGRDRQAASHGKAVLDALGGLQLAMLDGGGAKALETLSALAATQSEAADPRLRQVLRAIGQRAAIELSRAESGPGGA